MVPDEDELVPDEDELVPDEDELFLDEDELVPDEDELVPDEDELFLDEDELVPDEDEVFPDEDEVFPDEDEFFLDEDEVFPDEDEVFPDEDEVFPDEDEVFPDEDEVFLDEDEVFPDEDEVFLVENALRPAERGTEAHGDAYDACGAEVLCAVEQRMAGGERQGGAGLPVLRVSLASMAVDPRTDLLLVTVTKVETQAVLAAFGAAASGSDAIDGRVYFDLGTINGARVRLTMSEMGAGGLGAAQQAVQKGIASLSPVAVVMIGIAFGVNDQKQRIGDVLVTEQLRNYGLQRVGTENGAPKIVLRGDKPHASPWLLNLARSAEIKWEGATVGFGTVLTGEKLVDNLDFRDQLRALEPEAIGGEMEGAGLYVACADRKVDWLLVKAICDWADGHKATDKDERQALAAKNAAAFFHHVLSFVQHDWNAHRTSPHTHAVHPQHPAPARPPPPSRTSNSSSAARPSWPPSPTPSPPSPAPGASSSTAPAASARPPSPSAPVTSRPSRTSTERSSSPPRSAS